MAYTIVGKSVSKVDKEDRLILMKKDRFVGDAVAAVIATDELIAKKALKLIRSAEGVYRRRGCAMRFLYLCPRSDDHVSVEEW